MFDFEDVPSVDILVQSPTLYEFTTVRIYNNKKRKKYTR